MAENPISVEVQQFVVRYIRSVEQLEILLLLNQNPERRFSIHEVFRHIQSSEKSVADGLAFFAREGIVVADGSEYGMTEDAAARQLVRDLAKAYRERRVAVIELIYSKPPDGIQNFADAFRFRKKD